jgi:aldose 1-epimerase
MDVITLRAGEAGLELVPAVGGAIGRYWSGSGRGTVEWLRPTPADTLPRGDPYQTAGFPLVPYSNRIRGGRFAFGGRPVALPLNRPPERHSLHGHGWQAGWKAVAVGPDRAELEYLHLADAWPWRYRARQRITLAPERLVLELALTNEAERPMPAGLGWHPYFPGPAGTTITAEVRSVWLMDAELMPTELVPARRVADPGTGLRTGAVALDHCFTGWGRRAVIEWPEQRARLVMTAESPLDFLQLYTPPGRDFFCAEPVSHATDAVNLAAAGRSESGLLILEPGQAVSTVVTLAGERYG